LNFKRAELPVMREVLAGLLSERQLDELKEFARNVPDCTLEEAFLGLKLPKETAALLRSVLTDTSSCWGLWVIAVGGTRNWYSLYVAQAGDAQNDSQRWLFTW